MGLRRSDAVGQAKEGQANSPEERVRHQRSGRGRRRREGVGAFLLKESSNEQQNVEGESGVILQLLLERLHLQRFSS